LRRTARASCCTSTSSRNSARTRTSTPGCPTTIRSATRIWSSASAIRTPRGSATSSNELCGSTRSTSSTRSPANASAPDVCRAEQRQDELPIDQDVLQVVRDLVAERNRDQRRQQPGHRFADRRPSPRFGHREREQPEDDEQRDDEHDERNGADELLLVQLAEV